MVPEEIEFRIDLPEELNEGKWITERLKDRCSQVLIQRAIEIEPNTYHKAIFILFLSLPMASSSVLFARVSDR